MVFSDVRFIYAFLPLFLLAYFITPKKWRNTTLFVGSMVFYGIGSKDQPIHILIFATTLVMNYFLGRLIGMTVQKKFWLWVGIIADIANLAVYKYVGVPVGLPIGISFYTFQAVSYLIDVYRGTCKEETSFIRYGAYLSMFPQLIAGPIVTYPEVRKKLIKREYSFENFVEGLQVFILGLGSKVILANRVSGLWNQVGMIGYESISTPLAWMGIAAFSFQIYFDFWGYSLMAIGLGQMLGFTIPTNFNYPYTSTSVSEFWRRWHITLGSWFREYVYIPLGGNRRGLAIQIRNMLIVWSLTGIWHGAGWNFLLWGLVIFCFMSMEKFGLGKVLDKHKGLGHIYMILFIPLSWALFAITDFSKLGVFFGRLFGIHAADTVIYGMDWLKYGKQYGIWLLLCLICSTKLPKLIRSKVKGTMIENLILLGIFAGVAYCLYNGMNDPFLYFRF